MLSTPPAFILSQDQTLMLWCEFRRNLLLRVTSAKRNSYVTRPVIPYETSLFKWLLCASPSAKRILNASTSRHSSENFVCPRQINLASIQNRFWIYCLRLFLNEQDNPARIRFRFFSLIWHSPNLIFVKCCSSSKLGHIIFLDEVFLILESFQGFSLFSYQGSYRRLSIHATTVSSIILSR